MIKNIVTDYIPDVVISKELMLLPSQVITNIEELVNTRWVNTPIVLSQNWKRFKTNDKIVITVFGGGYSSGAILLKNYNHRL